MSNPEKEETKLPMHNPNLAENSRLYYDVLMETRKPLRKIYYSRDKAGQVFVANHPYNSSGKTVTYYKTTEHHIKLLTMLENLPNKILQCEDNFQKYLANTFSGQTKQANSALKGLLKSLKKLHPFFFHKQNSLYYILEKIKEYFIVTLDFHLTEDTIKENEKKVKGLFILAINPITREINNITEEVLIPRSMDRIWDDFCHIVNSPTESPFIKKRSVLPNIADVKILQSLFDLENLLKEYAFIFSRIIEPHSGHLSKGQFFSLFLTSPGINTFLNELNNIQHFSTPDALFQILLGTMEENFKSADDSQLGQLYQSLYQATYNVNEPDILEQETQEFINRKKLITSSIYIDSDYNKLDTFTCNIRKFFRTQDKATSSESYGAYFAFLNKIIDPKCDKLFETDIYEVYTFEQLIYLELFHLIQSGLYIQKCTNPDCCKYFIPDNNRRKYCVLCRDKRPIVIQKYERKRKDRLHQIQKKLYNQCYYQMRSLPKDSPERIALGNWRVKISMYLDGLSDDDKALMSNTEFIDHICSATYVKDPLSKYMKRKKTKKKFPD